MFGPAKKILRAENTDLFSGKTLVTSCVENVHNLPTEQKLSAIGFGIKPLLKVVLLQDEHKVQMHSYKAMLMEKHNK